MKLFHICKYGDVLTYTGHEMLVYDLEYDENGTVKNAYLMHSMHGKGGKSNYIKTKISYSNIYLYHNSYSNSWNKEIGGLDDGIEGSINLTKIRSGIYWENINKPSWTSSGKNYTRMEEYTVLRFIHEDDNGNAVLKYNGEKYNDRNHYNENQEGEIIKISKKTQDRIKYSKLYIEKTVDAHEDDIVEPNDDLTYTISIKNCSKEDYIEPLIVTENLSKYVTYKNYEVKYYDGESKVENRSISNYNENVENNKIEWNIGVLKSGEKIEIKYTVKVKEKSNGNTIISTGKVGNIPSATVKNKIENNLTENQEGKIVDAYNNLKDKYRGKELINEIYKKALEVDLVFDEFDITNLINNKQTSHLATTISLNKENSFCNQILNNYWSTLYLAKSGNIDLKSWEAYDSDNRRADTIYSENFKTGDILFYTNYNDLKYNSEDRVTFENGEYAYIYIEGQGFVGINLGNDGVAKTQDDRNIFSPSYYSENELSISSYPSENNEELEFYNYQTLFGKDYYVILRPALEINKARFVESTEYTINQEDKNISKINVKESIEQFKNKFNVNSEKVHIYTNKSKQTEVQEGIVKTGMVATFEGIDGDYEISVKGDTNGDGELTLMDITIINNFRLYGRTNNFEGVYRLSADVNNDNKIDFFDMVMINNCRLHGTGF